MAVKLRYSSDVFVASLLDNRRLKDVLHDLTFLGLEIAEGQFVFSDETESSRKNKIRARRFARRKGQEERFQIHRIFRPFLEIEDI